MNAKLILSFAIALCALVFLGMPAFAGSNEPGYDSWYAGFDVLASGTGDSSVTGQTAGTVGYKTGVSLGDLKLGYRPQALYGEGGDFRFEAELATRSLGVDFVRSGGNASHPGGDLNMGAVMANGYYDLRTKSAFTPYVGAGVGFAALAFSKNPGLGVTDKKSDKVVPAGQISVGVSYAPEMLQGTDWSIGYNYFAVGRSEFKASGNREKLDGLGVSSLQLGFKYHF